MTERNSSRDRGLIYVSQNLWKLRCATLTGWLPAVIGVWLLLRTGPAGWNSAPLAAATWWIPLAVVGVFTVLLSAVLILGHGRYVTRVALDFDGGLRVTTFLLWGQRTEKLRAEEIAARRFRLDRAGEAPLGFEILGMLGFPRPK